MSFFLQVRKADTLDSVAIGAIVTSTISRAMKLIPSAFSSPLAKGRGWGEESLVGHDRSIQLYPSSCTQRAGAIAPRPISRPRIAKVFAISHSAVNSEGIRHV